MMVDLGKEVSLACAPGFDPAKDLVTNQDITQVTAKCLLGCKFSPGTSVYVSVYLSVRLSFASVFSW
jgi:hypothetical protein